MPRRILIKQYQELDPNSPEEVHEIWSCIHLLCMVTCTVCGAVTAYLFGLCLQQFDFRCFLFAKFYEYVDERFLRRMNISDEATWSSILNRTYDIKVDYQKAKWGESKVCDFVQFLHICSMLSAVLWLVFLILPGRDRNMESQIFEKPHRLMFPLLTWSIIASLVMIGANSTLFSGLDQFCLVLKDEKKHKVENLCLSVKKKPYELFFGTMGNLVYRYLAIVKATAVVGSIGWIVNVSWTLLRMYLLIDYKVYVVRIWRYLPDPPKKERKHVKLGVVVK